MLTRPTHPGIVTGEFLPPPPTEPGVRAVIESGSDEAKNSWRVAPSVRENVQTDGRLENFKVKLV